MAHLTPIPPAPQHPQSPYDIPRTNLSGVTAMSALGIASHLACRDVPMRTLFGHVSGTGQIKQAGRTHTVPCGGTLSIVKRMRCRKVRLSVRLEL